MKLLLRVAISVFSLSPSVMMWMNRPQGSCEIPNNVIVAMEYNYQRMDWHNDRQARAFKNQMIDLVNTYWMDQVEKCF